MQRHTKVSFGSMFVIAMGAATLLLHPGSARSARAEACVNPCSPETGCTLCGCTRSNGWDVCEYKCGGATCGGGGTGGDKPVGG